MAWLTVLGPDPAQVDYRLEEGAGCGMTPDGPDHHHDHGQGTGRADQVGYRMDETNRLTWFGGGLAEVGIAAGTLLSGQEHKQWARALMDGVHPHTGEQLVKPKRAAHPKGKLSAAPFLAALDKQAAERGMPVEELPTSKWGQARVGRLVRMVGAEGEAHRVPVKDLERLAEAVGLDLTAVYAAAELAQAREYRDRSVRIGDRGYDLTLDIPKSPSVVWALADPATAALLEGAFREAVTETLGDVERWCGYGMRGHNGEGHTSQRVESSGLLGWVMWHEVARPVNGQDPDPHLHAHAVIAHLVRGADGKWSVPGNGGREFHRHVQAAGAMAQARFRHNTTALGFRWEQADDGGAWELTGVPPAARALFSKRNGQVRQELLARLGLDLQDATTAQAKTAAATSRENKPQPTPTDTADPTAEPTQSTGSMAQAQAATPAGRLRAGWVKQARNAGLNPEQIVAAARPDPPGTGLGGPQGPGGPAGPPSPSPSSASSAAQAPPPAQIAERVFDPGQGICAHAKAVGRARVLAAVVDQLPAGIADLQAAQALTDAVLGLDGGPAVVLPQRGPAYQTHPERYTTRDITQAEQQILAVVRAGYDTGRAVVGQEVAELAIATYQTGAGFALSAEQRQVVLRLTGAGHGVDAVIGVAGSGKTTLMAAARTAFQAQGLIVAGAATAAVAAQALRAEAGIASATIASWLARIDDPQQPGLAGVDVLVVDEAAMVDDRELARVLAAAQQAGTKVVLIGDPVQLKAIGVGGGFAATHRQVDGLTLTENRRQRDGLQRRALQHWREGDRTQALRTWAVGGHVHAGQGRDDTLTAMIGDWAEARQALAAGAALDPHEELAGLLMLAGTNADVEALNAGARAIRRQLGEITGAERVYRLAGGGSIALAVGDHIRVRANDYRTRREGAPADAVDVLNGYRGIVTGFGGPSGREVRVSWRRPGMDGPDPEITTLSPAYIARGGVSHGTAMTVAAAQGQTGDVCLVYGAGLDPHALYPAMSRDRHGVGLYLPRALLETDADRARHGQVHSPADELTRAVNAYARALQGDRADKLVLTELGAEPDPIAHQTTPDQAAEPQPAPEPAPAAEAVPAVVAWQQRSYGERTDTELHRLITDYTREARRLAALQQRTAALEDQARAGHGPQAAALRERRQALAAAAAAEAHLPAAHAAVEQADADADKARTRIGELTGQARRGRIALRISGTSRTAVQAELAQAQQDLQDALERHRHAHARLGELTTAAAAPYPTHGTGRWQPGAAVTEHHQLTTAWQAHLAQAIDGDVATAPSRAAAPADAALVGFTRSRTAAEAHQRLAAVRAELALRQDMPVDLARSEHQERTTHQQKQDAARPSAHQRTGRRRHDPTRGPTLGR